MSFASPPNEISASGAAVLGSVQAAIRDGELVRATNLARNALESGRLVHPLLLHLRSHWLEAQGRIPEALLDLRQAVAIAPNDAIAHFALGELLMKLADTAGAMAAFDATVALRPDYAPAYNRLGLVKCLVGESEAGRVCYDRAIALNPKDADSLASLAELAQQRGDDVEAHALINRTFALVPTHQVAMTVLASLSVAEGSFDKAETLLANLRADSRRVPQDRAILTGIVGDLRHAQKRYGEAFKTYSAANADKRAIFAADFERPGQKSARDYALWLAGYLETAPASGRRAQPASADAMAAAPRAHVFLVGFPRSGTTLLQNVLAGSPDVVALQEQGLLFEAVRDFLSNDEGRARLCGLDEADIDGYRARYWQRVEQHGLDVRGKVFIDNHPLNAMKLLLVSRFFPDAKVVFATRDPRDVVFSCFRRSFAMSPSMYEFLDLERAARFYDAVMRLSQSYRDTLGLEWCDLRYEALVEDFETELQALCDFIGVEKNSAMRDFAALSKTRKIATLNAAPVKRGLNKESIGQWRNYAAQLKPVLPVLLPWIEKFGYAPD